MYINKALFFFVILFTCTLTFAQNKDESKAGEYTLPELLRDSRNAVITTSRQWESRRPEIVKLFEDHVYGQVPGDFDKIQFKTLKKDAKALNGKAVFKHVAITVTRNKNAVTINLYQFYPKHIKTPVPAFLVINHRGIKSMDVTRKNRTEFWPVEEVIDAGYAIAGFDVKDVAPDNKATYADQILKKLYPEQLEVNNGMRALGAWGWGASRIIDYFEKDKAIDERKVIVVGHSRGGKAALWCGAQDQRVAIAISNESGNSGAKISRRNYGETVKRITTSFPHWFCPNYKQYGGNESKLPVDQHMLLGLMAPRGVYVATAAEDHWADAKGQYLALFESQPVYHLYGMKTNLAKEMPGVDQQRIQYALGFHHRAGKHDMTIYDWKQFIRFAKEYGF